MGEFPGVNSGIWPGSLGCESQRGVLRCGMETQTTARNVLRNVKDLSREPPRSPRERIGNYVLMARMIDKGRAALAGTVGEYHFNCPVDNMLFNFKGVNGDEVREMLASGVSDLEVLEWFNNHGTPKTD